MLVCIMSIYKYICQKNNSIPQVILEITLIPLTDKTDTPDHIHLTTRNDGLNFQQK